MGPGQVSFGRFHSVCSRSPTDHWLAVPNRSVSGFQQVLTSSCEPGKMRDAK
jgi:hypothetical protein